MKLSYVFWCADTGKIAIRGSIAAAGSVSNIAGSGNNAGGSSLVMVSVHWF